MPDPRIEPNPVDRPANVIWIFGDQHRAQACSYRGDPNVYTPNIDNLARDGMRFDAAVAGAPWCSPFRGALLTGLYPHQCGVTRTPEALDPSIPTVTEPFRGAGYHTAYVGKWHLDGSNWRHTIPPERRGGFDYWVGYENNNIQNEVFVHGDGCEGEERLEGYETDALTDRFLAHLRDHVGPGGEAGDYQHFFAVLSVQPPHDPYVAPTNPRYATTRRHPNDVVLRPNVPPGGDYAARARLMHAGYYAMIENLDWNIGRIREGLKELGVDRETYIVFFSDHGDMLWSHGHRGKSSPWEESIRIPFIISRVGGPHNMWTGICDAVLNHVDIAPTSLGLCGIQVPETMPGFDYSGRCIHRKAPEHRDTDDRGSEPDSAYLQHCARKRHPVERDRKPVERPRRASHRLSAPAPFPRSRSARR